MTDDIHNLINAHSKRLNTYRNKIERLEDENEDLRRRIAELEEVVHPDPEKSTDELTKDEKVRKLRKALIREALDATGGRSAMKYDEVRALFDMSISPSYSYDLMEAAGRMDGFSYERAGTQNQGQKRIACNMDAVNDKTLVHSVKKGSQSIPA